MNIEELLTILEVEKKLHVDGSTVRRWIQQGKIKAYRFGRAYKIPKSEFERFVEKSVVGLDKESSIQEKRRFSMQGMFKGGEPITKEAIDEVIKEWEKE
jgi:excisionase family DNA binding protein